MAIGKVNTGGGGAGGKLTVTAPVGATATCQKDGRIYTRTIRPDGTAVFNGLKTGVWNVEINKEGELPSSQDVLITADYAVTLAFFSTLVDVTYPAGSQCICTDNDIILTATDTSGHMVFNIQRVGRWYIRCTDGNQTAERYVDVTATGQSFTITMAYFAATINVTYPAGSTCTCSKGDIVFNAPDTSGTATFTVPETGNWVILSRNESSGESEQQIVTITSDGDVKNVSLSYVKIYGIQRDITNQSPLWTRTDDAVGVTEPTASVGTVAGQSVFDNFYPWSGIHRETLSTGDVMVKIPKFWFKRWLDENVEHIQIADKATEGFTLHPAFNHVAMPCDYIYVAAYKTSSNNKSASGASPTVSKTRAAMRTDAKNKGTGWSIMDIAARSAVQMLVLVEFATNNMQTAIGRGFCDKPSGSTRLNTGSTNGVPNLTGRPAGTDGLVDIVYRGIEGLWGNTWEWIDGVNINNGEYYVCNDITKYADDTATNHTKLSFKGATNWYEAYITKEGVDTGSNSHVMLPEAAGSGSETTYQCDSTWTRGGWVGLVCGGDWSNGSVCGLFADSMSDGSSYEGITTGSRLLYIPS